MSTVDSRNVVLLFSAGDCGHCVQFKKTGLFAKLQKDINDEALVRFVHIEIATMSQPDKHSYPKIINQWGNWYPRLVMVNGKDWNERFLNTDPKNPNIVVFNGIVKDGVVTVNRESQKGLDEVMNWIHENVDNNDGMKSIIRTKSTTTTLLPAVPAEYKSDAPTYIPTCGSVRLRASRR